MNKILVIGAGIFGLDLAIQLSKIGYQVTIFEKNDSILSGTTGSSLLRVHSGLHYPRDIATAKQSMNGYKVFKEKYSDCIRDDFKNYYAIAKQDSRTTTSEFEGFANLLSFPYNKLNKNFEYAECVDMNKLSSIYEVTEGVVDVIKLKDKFGKQIVDLNIDFRKNHFVLGVNNILNYWKVSFKTNESTNPVNNTKHISSERFKYVIDSTHSTNQNFFLNHQINDAKFEYQLTYMINVKTQIPTFGLTVLDGNFITVLPLGFSDLISVYGPKESVLARHIGGSIPKNWHNIDYVNDLISSKNEDEIFSLLEKWVPGAINSKIISKTTGIRTIESNVKESDRRISSVEEKAPGLITITSTKIDHSPEISDIVCKKIQSLEV
jgi:hypothetical protein